MSDHFSLPTHEAPKTVHDPSCLMTRISFFEVLGHREPMAFAIRRARLPSDDGQIGTRLGGLVSNGPQVPRACLPSSVQSVTTPHPRVSEFVARSPGVRAGPTAKARYSRTPRPRQVSATNLEGAYVGPNFHGRVSPSLVSATDQHSSAW